MSRNQAPAKQDVQHGRRMDRLEDRYRPHVNHHPTRIPDWMRPCLDPLTIEDLEILEAGGWVDGADGDPESLSPKDRERYHELAQSWETFQEVRQP